MNRWRRPSTSDGGFVIAVLGLMGSSAMAQLIPLLLGPWLTRLYSAESFGTLHIVTALATNLAVVASLRYEFALPQSRDGKTWKDLNALCWRLWFATTLLSGLLGAIASIWLKQYWPLCLPFLVSSMAAVFIANLQASSQGRFRQLGWSRVIQYGGAVIFQLVAGYLGMGWLGLVSGVILANVLALGVLRPEWQWQESALGRVVMVAKQYRDFPILNAPHAFLAAVQDSLTLLLIAGLLDATAAGWWGLAMRYLKAPASLVGGAISQVLYPRLCQHTGLQLNDRKLLRQVIVLLTALSLPVCVTLFFVGEDLFAFAFGEHWRASGQLASALSLYLWLYFVASPLGVVTMALNAQAWALRVSVSGQVLFLLALGVGLWHTGNLVEAAKLVSIVMAGFFFYYLARLYFWPMSSHVPIGKT